MWLFPKAWVEFDRWSSISAADRVQQAFHRVGLSRLRHLHELHLFDAIRQSAHEILAGKGYSRDIQLILLNPAGAWQSRNWPVENYITLAKLFLQSGPCKFLLLGTDRIREKATRIEAGLRQSVINLTGFTSLSEAMAILPHVSLVVSEDSGLMHMAWASGVPTIALFGSTRHDWSSPVGPHVRVFHSGDLECGDCMDPICKFGDVHCLTRISPQMVFDAAFQLLGSEQSK
jgi:ADP-heptose:LPS heptosyltransferase